MSALDILGTNAAVEQGKKKRYQRGGSEDLLWTYRGPTAAVNTLYEAFKASALIDPRLAVLDLDEGRGLATLTVVYADDQATLGVSTENGITKIYEFIPNEFSKRPELAPYFEDITNDQIVQAYNAYRAGATDAQATAAPYNLADYGYVLYKLLITGTEEYQQSAYVLRESKVVSGKNAVQTEFANVNRVETPPTAASSNNLIGAISALGGEWLKKAPAIRQISKTKWSVVTEWWWADKWSAVLYGGTLVP